MRTPLTSIQGAMDYISARLADEIAGNSAGVQRDDLFIFSEVIKKKAERLIRLVNDMLDIERIETGVSEIQTQPVNLSHVITETVTACQVEAGNKNIHLSCRVDQDLVVAANEDRMRQVVTNLLCNSLDFSPPAARSPFGLPKSMA